MFGFRDVKVAAVGEHPRVHIKKLDMHMNDRIIIRGPNGSGKSTLIKLVAGLTRATSGEFYVGKEVKRTLIGFLPQAGGISPNLSVSANAMLMRGLLGARAASEVAELAIMLGLAGLMQRDVWTLSGGFQRIAALFAILSTSAEILLLDEPLTSLDAKAERLARLAIRQFAGDRALVVATGHTGDDRLLVDTDMWNSIVDL